MRRRDGGAAAVEFVMMSVLLVFVLFALLQVAVFCYTRNVVSAATGDAARYAAALGSPPGAGTSRAAELITSGMNADTARRIHCTTSQGVDGASGLPITTVHCVGRMRTLFTPLVIPLTIDVTASTLTERKP